MLGDIERLLTRELQGFQREIELFPDDERMWHTVPGVTNSAANLAWHVCGGLQHFIGGVLGNSGYVRDRDAEFNRRSGSRAELVAEITATIAVVQRTLAGPAAGWIGKPFPIEINGMRVRTEIFLMHLASHAAFHLGQAGYLRRILLEDSRSSGPVPLAPLVDGFP
jgi:hypothetical protein